MTKPVIIGCGDVGKRLAHRLIATGLEPLCLVRSQDSAAQCSAMGLNALAIDLDQNNDYAFCHAAQVYYLAPPSKQGVIDQRARTLLQQLSAQAVRPEKVVLISTTGVYGDQQGEWVTEQTATEPKTERGQRRLDLEHQWRTFCKKVDVELVVLRVPGIYANSRIPRKRIEQALPVMRASESGFSNRIHADDLAMVMQVAMESECGAALEIFNTTDGTPGKMTEYLQAAADQLGLPRLKEMSWAEAQGVLSEGMLSYLGESRKISNQKMLEKLKVTLRYPNFVEGLKHG